MNTIKDRLRFEKNRQKYNKVDCVLGSPRLLQGGLNTENTKQNDHSGETFYHFVTSSYESKLLLQKSCFFREKASQTLKDPSGVS